MGDSVYLADGLQGLGITYRVPHPKECRTSWVLLMLIWCLLCGPAFCGGNKVMRPWEVHCTTGRLKESRLLDSLRVRVAALEDTGKSSRQKSTVSHLIGRWSPGQALLLPTKKLHLSQTDVHIHIMGL